jgi:hypothetical protein
MGEVVTAAGGTEGAAVRHVPPWPRACGAHLGPQPFAIGVGRWKLTESR